MTVAICKLVNVMNVVYIDDDYVGGHLSAMCFFVTRQKKSLIFSL